MHSNRYFLSTAIPYVNAKPHIGFALELVQADCFVRYLRFLNHDVFFLTGTDENALKNVQAAEKKGITPKRLVDNYALTYQNLTKILLISNDDFIRTTEERHVKGVQKLWKQICFTDIYKKEYKGFYCVGCEQFLTLKELENGRCPEHLKRPEFFSEENFFFKLSKYQKFLAKLIKKDCLRIIPEKRKKEVVKFINSGIHDLSISRSRKRAKSWGIPVPYDSNQIIYVWYDALANYITALGYGDNQHKFKKYWLEADERVHFIGKGIVRFHAVYWPAMLFSADLPLPTKEFVHGYITVNGQKMSKSLGNVIDPFKMVKKYGVDAVRYYLLREIPSYGDGDFSERRFKELYNADLANTLGNLVSRTARLSAGQISLSAKLKKLTLAEFKNDQTYHKFFNLMDKFQFDESLRFIWTKIAYLNKYLDKKEPWNLAETDKNKVMQVIIDKLATIAMLLKPFLPCTSKKILQYFKERQKEKIILFPRIK